eukprot:6121404-Prymnesium_polylepis.1
MSGNLALGTYGAAMQSPHPSLRLVVADAVVRRVVVAVIVAAAGAAPRFCARRCSLQPGGRVRPDGRSQD